MLTLVHGFKPVLYRQVAVPPTDTAAPTKLLPISLIVPVPTEILGHDSPPRDGLQDFASLLHAEGAFTGLTWHDAKHAATAIMFDAINRMTRPRPNTARHHQSR